MFERQAITTWLVALALLGGGITATAQNRRGASALRGVPALPPPENPVVLYTAEQPRILVVPIVDGLEHPWGMAFRANGDILVTERDRGTLRIIRNGQLLDSDIPGAPEVFSDVLFAGLMDVEVHPEDDTIVYLTYSKAEEHAGRQGALQPRARVSIRQRCTRGCCAVAHVVEPRCVTRNGRGSGPIR